MSTGLRGGDVPDSYLFNDDNDATEAPDMPDTAASNPLAPESAAPAVLSGGKPASPLVTWVRHRARVRGQLDAVPDGKVGRAQRRMHRAVELEALAADARAEAWNNRRVKAWMLAALAVFALGGAVLSAVFSALSVTAALALQGAGWFVASMGPDLLMGGLLALGLVMRSVIAQRGLTLSDASHRAYRTADAWLGGLIATITVGPSLGAAVMAGIAWRHGQPAAGFGWALVSVAVHAIGPVIVVSSGALAPHITGDLARISQHTAQRLADQAATSTNTTSPQVATIPAATSDDNPFGQVTAGSAATSGNGDPVIARARRELGTNVSGKQVANWHRTHIGPVEQKRVGEIRDALKTDSAPRPVPAA